MKKVTGFTLIELIVVIVILGILAAVAAPKFMDLQTDARVASIKGLVAAIHSSSSMVFAKAMLAGKTSIGYTTTAYAQVCSTGSAYTDISKCTGVKVALDYGYPAATEDGLINAIDGGFQVKTDDNTPAVLTNSWHVQPTMFGEDHVMLMWQIGNNEVSCPTGSDSCSGCGLYYQAPTKDGDIPTIQIIDDKC